MIGAAGPRLLALAARQADIVTLCPRTRQDVLDSPHLLAGTPEQIAEDLLSYRERYGISYWVVQDIQPFARVLPRQPFAQVLPRLAGR